MAGPLFDVEQGRAQRLTPGMAAASRYARDRDRAAVWRPRSWKIVLAFWARLVADVQTRRGGEAQAWLRTLQRHRIELPATDGATRMLRGPLTRSSAWARPLMLRAPRQAPTVLCQAVAVLPMPDDSGALFSGKARQALRTNTTKARNQGCSVRRVHGAESAALDALLCLDWFGPDPGFTKPPLFTQPDSVSLVVVDATGTILAVAIATYAGVWAHLDVFTTTVAGRALGPDVDGRYLLHTALVADLHARGVRTLLCECALTVNDGLQYQQHLLGFFPVTLDVGIARC